MQQYAKNWLPLLFNAYIASDVAERGVLGNAVSAYAGLADAATVASFFRTVMQKLIKVCATKPVFLFRDISSIAAYQHRSSLICLHNGIWLHEQSLEFSRQLRMVTSTCSTVGILHTIPHILPTVVEYGYLSILLLLTCRQVSPDQNSSLPVTNHIQL